MKNEILLSVLIPVFNEEKTISTVVKMVKKSAVPADVRKEIIVVDDASTDKSQHILKKIAGIRLFKHKVNQGKGASIMTAISHAKGDMILIQDADLEYDPKYYSKLIRPIVENKADVVYGTRLKNYPLRLYGKKKTPLISHYLGNRFLSLVTQILFNRPISDMETGYKVFNKSAIDGFKINSKRFDFEAEITAKLLKKGVKIREIPITINPRGYDEGKKITWKDGFRALYTLLKYRITD